MPPGRARLGDRGEVLALGCLILVALTAADRDVEVRPRRGAQRGLVLGAQVLPVGGGIR